MPTTPNRSIKMPWAPERKNFDGMKPSDNFYTSPLWRKFRKGFIARNPLCVECEKQGKITASSVADHIIPIANGGEKWDYLNIMALCASCHNKKSANQRWRK